MLMLTTTLAGCLGGDDASSDSDTDEDTNGGDSGFADSDGDGVADVIDSCPDTPVGTVVGNRGCAEVVIVDTDGDGIPDDDEVTGCTDSDASNFNEDATDDDDSCDTDADGVVDSADTCPGTLAGTEVDENGCEIIRDDDGDGVPNASDQCNGHDDNVDVDEDNIPDGCDSSVDSDGDGVDDSSDNCPDTLSGIAVDEFGCEVVEGETIEVKIGVLTPRTGSNSHLAEGLENAAQMAIDEINGQQSAYVFSLVFFDTESSGSKGSTGTWSLIEGDGVSGIIGGSSMAIMDGAFTAPLNQPQPKPIEHQIPVITPFVNSAGLDEVTDDNLIWRVIPSESDSASAAAMWSNIYELSDVGIIHVDDGFGRSYARTYTEEYGAENICTTISYPSNSQNFESQANELINAGCSNVMIATHVQDGAMLIDDLGDAGFVGSGARVVTSHELGFEDFPNSLQDKTRVLGMVGANHGSWISPLFADFNSTYQSLFTDSQGQPLAPAAHSASSYDATMIMIRSVIQAGSTTGSDINDAIPMVGTEYAGIGGTIDFDTHGNTPGMNYDLFRFEATSAGEQADTDFEEIGFWSKWGGISSNCRANADPTVIGMLSPRTGIHSPYAQGEEHGVELGVELLNINQRSLCFSLSVADTQSTQSGAASAMQALVNAGVIGVIGPHSTEEALGAIPIAESNMVPIIGYGTFSDAALEEAWEDTHPEVQDYGYFWRVGVGADHHAAAIAAHISNSGYSDVAILHHDGLDETALADALTALLSSTCSIQSFSSGQTDFSAEITALSNCDAVVILGEVNEGASILSEISSQSLTIAKIGGHGLGDIALLQSVAADPSVIDGLTGIRMGIDHDMAEYDHELKFVYDMNYGGDVPAYASWSGDATLILGTAAGSSDAAGDVTGERVNLLIPFAADQYAVSSGEITLDDSTGDTSHTNLDVYQWGADGTFIEIGRWRLDLGLVLF